MARSGCEPRCAFVFLLFLCSDGETAVDRIEGFRAWHGATLTTRVSDALRRILAGVMLEGTTVLQVGLPPMVHGWHWKRVSIHDLALSEGCLRDEFPYFNAQADRSLRD